MLALTPVAALMFRFNNPDALLVLLLVAAAYCVGAGRRERRSTRWIALAGCAIGFALPDQDAAGLPGGARPGALALLCGRADDARGSGSGSCSSRGVAIVVSAGWYVALVSLWPADSRPYIGGSTDNSLLELALGYNGLGRILGGEGNGGGAGAESAGGFRRGEAAGGMPGAAPGRRYGRLRRQAGLTRMFARDRWPRSPGCCPPR